MTKHRWRLLAWSASALLVGALALVAAGCGGSSSSSSGGTTTTTGANTSGQQSVGKGEGKLNLIEWPYYSDPSFAKKFTQQTGCVIQRKDAGEGAKRLFDVFVRNSNAPTDTITGPLAFAAGLLTWIYVTAVIILFGAEVIKTRGTA